MLGRAGRGGGLTKKKSVLMSYHICQEEGAFIANPSVLPLVQTTFLPALFIPVSLCLRNAFGAELVDTSTLLAMVLLNGLMFAHCA